MSTYDYESKTKPQPCKSIDCKSKEFDKAFETLMVTKKYTFEEILPLLSDELNENFYVGACVRIMGRNNCVVGWHNHLIGDNNHVLGQNNWIQGNNNIVLGSGHVVKGDGLVIKGGE